MQSHLECRLWNEIFVDAQKALGIPNGARWGAGGGAGCAAGRRVHARALCGAALMAGACPDQPRPVPTRARPPARRHHQGHVPHRDAARRL